jgi:glucose/arabinose dehydrogenase
MSPSRRRFLAALGTASVAGCTSPVDTDSGTPTEPLNHTPSPAMEWEAPTGSPTAANVSPTTLIENLEVPWDLAFTPDGELFITERVGRVTRFDGEEVRTLAEPDDAIDAGSIEPGSDERPWWVTGGEGGTLGVAIHPRYPNPPHVCVYYTAEQGAKRVNRVVRYDAGADDPESTAEPLVDGIPANNYHNGGRLAFGPQNYLWVTTGDAGEPAKAQDHGTLNGKILRIKTNGEPAPDNPDHDDPRVFSYGHRNPQGVTWTPDNVTLATEHGPSARDEVNRLVGGDNYGWNVARGGSDDERWDAYTEHSEFHPPLVNTGPGESWAPTGCDFYTGDAIPAWRNRLVIGTLIGQHINVVTLTPPGGELPPLDGDSRRFAADWFDETYVATSHKLLQNVLGRVRRVAQGPDGDLFAITSNRDGRAKGKFPRKTDDVLVRLEG